MAFYYVKSGGTATGDLGRDASQRTTSFAIMGTGNYYGNIRAAMDATTTPVAGDSIRVSDIHSHSYSANTTYDGPTSGILLDIMSVSDTASDAYSVGAAEAAASSFDLLFVGRLSFSGIDITAGDDFWLAAANAQVRVIDGTAGVTGSNDIIRLSGDGCSLVLVNSDLVMTGTTVLVDMSNGAYLEMTGGSVTSSSDFLVSNWDTGGATVRLNGTDLSTVDSYVLSSVGGSPTTDDAINIELNGCEMSATLTGYVEETFTSLNHKFSAFNSSNTSAASLYQFFVRTMNGDAEDQSDAGIHRDESTAFPDTTKVSIKTTTTASASTSNPFVFDLPARYMELATASTDTARVYFAVSNATTLTDTNCWAELIYPDGTNKQHYNYLSNRAADILATGTTHTDDSSGSTWKDGVSDLTAHNEYYMDIDTSGDVGDDSVPILRVYVSVPSITVYFDTTVDMVA